MQRTSIPILILTVAFSFSYASPSKAGPGDPFNGIDVSLSIVWSNGLNTIQAAVGDTIQGTILMGVPDFGISSYSVSVLAGGGLAVSSFNNTPPPILSSFQQTLTTDGSVVSSFNGAAQPLTPGPTSIVLAIGTVDLIVTGTGNHSITPFLAVGDGLTDNMLIDKSTGSAFTAASVNVVPEPTVALLMAMGLGVLSIHARGRHD